MPTTANTYTRLIGIAAYQQINPLPLAVINDVHRVHDDSAVFYH